MPRKHHQHTRGANKHASEKCTVLKVYVPSDYEKLHARMAKEVNNNATNIIEFLHRPDEVKRAEAFLQRVKVRMLATEELPETEDDRKYLSRFEVSKNCSGNVNSQWIEWIEPLIMQSRHPFSIIPPAGHNEDLMSSDYVLFASSNHLKSQYGTHTGTSYLIDAGVLFVNCVCVFICVSMRVCVSFAAFMIGKKLQSLLSFRTIIVLNNRIVIFHINQ